MPAATTTIKGQARSQAPVFDRVSFVRYMKNIGRAYRKQAMELVSLCRTFAQAQEQSAVSDHDLRIGLKAVDDALLSASEVKKRTSKEVDEKFATAIKVLSGYEKRYHPGNMQKTVCERMEAAKAEDKSASKLLNGLKEMLCLKASDDKKSNPMIVEFHLFKSLPDKSPTIVRQELGQGSNLREVLWNFSRFKDKKRLTLKQNPHFYLDLPTSHQDYGDDFNADPIAEDFQHAKICVLTDKPGRLYLETDKNRRAFGNFWVPDKAIIFKDVRGKLEGERIVQESIQEASHTWSLGNPPLSPTSQSQPASPRSPSPAVTAPPIDFAAFSPFQDWREPIRQGLITPETRVCIRATPPSNSSSSSPYLSSPIPLAGPGANDSSLSRLQIPTQATSQMCHTAFFGRSPASTPSRSSPRTVAPPSPKTFVPRPMAAVPLTSNQAELASATSSYITCGSEENGAAEGASGRDTTGTPSRKRCIQLSQSPVWQLWNRRYNPTS